LRGLFQNRKGPEQVSQAIDLPIDGSEMDAAAGQLTTDLSKQPTRLLIVRATEEPWPEWVTIAPAQGWEGRAEEVLVREVAANHLGVLLKPHVRILAQAIGELSQA
jgi:thioesterase domain-containing protein